MRTYSEFPSDIYNAFNENLVRWIASVSIYRQDTAGGHGRGRATGDLRRPPGELVHRHGI